MIATDANVSRILIARQTDSYLPDDVTVQKEWGLRNWGVLGQGAGKRLLLTQASPNFHKREASRPSPLSVEKLRSIKTKQ